MFPIIDWSLISLELFITAILVVMVVLDVLLPKDDGKDWLGILSLIGLGGLLAFWLAQRQLAGETFGGMWIMDSLAWFFKGFFLLAALFVFAMTQQFFKSLARRRNEFYLLLWMALLGMCLIASAADFLLLFIAIEIMTL